MKIIKVKAGDIAIVVHRKFKEVDGMRYTKVIWTDFIFMGPMIFQHKKLEAGNFYFSNN